MAEEHEMGDQLSLVLSPDSDTPSPALRAHTVISLDLNKDIMLSASGSEELDVGDEEQMSAELPPQSVPFEVLL